LSNRDTGGVIFEVRFVSQMSRSKFSHRVVQIIGSADTA
jgi:hypothetical protein